MSRDALEKRARARKELDVRAERDRQCAPGGLKHFVRYFWDVVEPDREYVHGWALDAIFDHLEAVADGRITRLVINVPPGAMKSLSANVFFPAWMWACRNPHKRFLAFSYAAHLTERDNQRFLDILQSDKFRRMYDSNFELRSKGMEKVSNSKRGWKFATSVGGVGTGERGDIVIIDDAHNLADGESKKVRESTTNWFLEAASNRLNDMEKSAIIVIGQRIHDQDICGVIFDKGLEYDHLMIPMEYEPCAKIPTSIGWIDPRTVPGECFFPERFPPGAVKACRQLGSFVWASQYQQRPEVKEGGLLDRSHWILWDQEKFPKFDYIIGSLDPAFTSKQSNDPSALTIWGVFTRDDRPHIMLMFAWRKWLQLHGAETKRWPGETDDDYRERCRPGWGLVETVAHDCRRLKVDRLLVEAKASGLSVAQEFHRLFPDAVDVELINPGNLDKEARVKRVQPILENGQVVHPNRRYADLVIDECAMFPRGAHDDLVDSATQAWHWLRSHGYLRRDSERDHEDREEMSDYRRSVPLYPALGLQ